MSNFLTSKYTPEQVQIWDPNKNVTFDDPQIVELQGQLKGPNALPDFVKRSQIFNRAGKVSDANFPVRAWDGSIYGPRVLQKADGTYQMFYGGYEGTTNYNNYWICMATSPDLITWTKPNLGLQDYGGNTNNNIILKAAGIGLQFCDCSIDPLSGKYLLSARNDNSPVNLLYESTNGINFTFVTGSSNSLGEASAITWNPVAGKYRRWYRAGGPNFRSIGYLDSSLLTGPWVDRGFIPEFTSTVNTLQYYDFTPFYHNGRMFANVNMFDTVSQLLFPNRCYVSDDHGDTWTRYMDMIRRPDPGSWDYGLITRGVPIQRNGIWYYYYGGKTAIHNAFGQIFLGLATAQIG